MGILLNPPNTPVETQKADRSSLLPVELLELIFVMCTDFPVFFPLRKGRSPLNFSQVCSHWRNISWQTKSLWSSIAYFPTTKRDRAAHVEELRRALDRSYPLSLEIVTGGLLEYPPKFDLRLKPESGLIWPLNPIQDIAIPYHDRLRVLRLSLSDHHLKVFLSITSVPFDLLEVLEISSFDYLHPDGEIEVLQNLPALNSFKFYSGGCRHPSLLRAPWAQLKTLHLHQAINPGDILQILGHATMVEDCSFVFSHGRPDLIQSPQIAVYPSIKKLKMNLLILSILVRASFLKGFVVPNVRDLTLVVRRWTDIPEHFLPGIKRLERLSLFHVSSTIEHFPLADLLNATPHLTSLVLHSPALDRAAFQTLFDPSLISHLQCLEFHVSNLQLLCDILSETVKGNKTSLKRIFVEFTTMNVPTEGQGVLTPADSNVHDFFDSLGVEVSLWSDVDGSLTLWYGPGREGLGQDAAALLREWHILD